MMRCGLVGIGGGVAWRLHSPSPPSTTHPRLPPSSPVRVHKLASFLSPPSHGICNQLPRPSSTMASTHQSTIPQELQRNENSMELAMSLENVKVLDLEGNYVSVTDLWEDRKVVIGFTRHFGCVLCMKRANLLASRKAEMDAVNVGLIIIGPGNVEQARGFVNNTKFPGEVYADPDYSAYKVFGFASGIATTFTPLSGMRIISAYLEGYRQDWHLSLQKDTVSKGGWQQGGVLVAGPGKGSISFLFKDGQAGDEPDMDDVMACCCAS